MPTLRLFAQAREVVGVAAVDLPGATVGEVLSAATDRFGEAFAAVLRDARVWCDGEPASADDPVGPDDELAVLPPVSGGAT